MSTTQRLSLTLGPVFYNWPVARWIEFYNRIADEAPVDRVCLGTVVCSKRQPFRDEVILDTVDRLERGGKEVVYSTLALPTTKREVRAIAEMMGPEAVLVYDARPGMEGAALAKVAPFSGLFKEALEAAAGEPAHEH